MLSIPVVLRMVMGLMFAAILTAYSDTTVAAAVTTTTLLPAPVVDVTVTTKQPAGSSAISSPSFSTAKPNELLVAFIASDGPGAGVSQSISSVTGGGLTWTLQSRANAQAGTAEIWQARTTSVVTNVIVTATRAAGSYQGMMTITAFQGASIVANGAAANASAASGASGVTLMTTQANSVVWGVGDDWDKAVARTVSSDQTKLSEYLAPAGDTFWVQYVTAPSAAAGLTATISCTAPTNDRWNLAAIEIVPDLIPSGPDTTPPAVTVFTVPASASAFTVMIASFIATDNIGVTGYLVNESASVPSPTDVGWSGAPQISYTFTTAGTKTLYAWAKDAAGNVSASLSANVIITVQTTGVEPVGWYAGDMHVHRSCGGSPETVSAIFQKMTPQNLSVISLLSDMGNGEVQNPVTDLPLVTGQDASISTSDKILHWDAEWHWDPIYYQYPHQALGGHIVALGLAEAHQIWEEYTYPVFNWAHQQNGIAGFVHMEYLDNNIPQSLTCCTPLEYPVEVALGTSDFISEDVIDTSNTGSGLNPEGTIQAYYRLLNCGFRPGLAAGTDYPCNDSRPLGSLLTYVQVAGGQMTYRNWIEGIAGGRTVVSRNGHNEFLDLKVNGNSTPGDEIRLAGAGTVQVTIRWMANQNLSGTIELVQNGVVVASQQASVASGAPASLSVTLDFARSGWLAARRMGGSGHQAHTGAVFVTVDNAPVRASVSDAEFYVQWMDNLLEKTSPGGAWSSYFVNSRSAAQARYQAAKVMYQQIASEAAMLLTVTTASLPGGALNSSYTAMLAASGGISPYTWAIDSGSLPPGLLLNSSTGAISGIPAVTGAFSFTARVTDSGNPAKSATRTLGIMVATQASSTIWPATTVPGVVDAGPDNAVELGVKFRSDSSGSITGIRFYKASTNTGVHVGNLWTNNGILLATATLGNETPSGWQQIDFPMPVAITANTVYVASYHASAGHYSNDQYYFTGKGVDSPPLHALADGVSGFNGVYAYGSTSNFPSQGWNSSNYWVDVAFITAAPPTATLTSIEVTPGNPAIITGVSQQFTATGAYSDGSTQNLTSQVAWASTNTGVATITSTGLARGVTAGTSTITATQGTVTGSTTLTVRATTPSINTASLPAGSRNIPYTAILAASGGTTPYTWSIASGSLPPGLSLNSGTGVVSGTPLVTGNFSFTARVTDSSSPGQSATRTLSIRIRR